MSRALVELVAVRLESVVGSARTVYRHAVPQAPTAEYLWVYSNSPDVESDDFGDKQAIRSESVWVASVARGPRDQAATAAVWGADRALAALAGWRPTIGAASWRPVTLGSQPPTRDESLPDVTVMVAVSQWGFTYQL